MTKPICAVIGVGPGNGAPLARRFAAGGYTVALLARTTEFTGNLAAEIGDARAYACDVTDRASVERAVASIRQDLGDVDALIYNAGSAPGVPSRTSALMISICPGGSMRWGR